MHSMLSFCNGKLSPLPKCGRGVPMVPWQVSILRDNLSLVSQPLTTDPPTWCCPAGGLGLQKFQDLGVRKPPRGAQPGAGSAAAWRGETRLVIVGSKLRPVCFTQDPT